MSVVSEVREACMCLMQDDVQDILGFSCRCLRKVLRMPSILCYNSLLTVYVTLIDDVSYQMGTNDINTMTIYKSFYVKADA